jgi:hypothetical protein
LKKLVYFLIWEKISGYEMWWLEGVGAYVIPFLMAGRLGKLGQGENLGLGFIISGQDFDLD